MRHFLTLKDFTKDEILEIIDIALEIKKDLKSKIYKQELKNQTLAMIFEKSSTRTRVSFETGMFQLGGHALFLSNRDIHLGRGEPLSDTARVISSMCDMVMIRTFEHSKIEEFAAYSKVPVVNGLTDSYHPVQLLADYMTLVEYGMEKNIVAAFVGDGNNMTHSWLIMGAIMGAHVVAATPSGKFAPDADVIAKAKAIAAMTGATIEITNDPEAAAKDASVLYTDVWMSMGDPEAERAEKFAALSPFAINDNLMAMTAEDSIFMHCLPAHRGEEVSASVIDGPKSVIWREAYHRRTTIQALLYHLTRGELKGNK